MVIDISAVAEGVMGAEGGGQVAGGGKGFAPSVVGVADHRCAAAVEDRNDVALEVGSVVILRAVVGNGQGRAGGIVAEVQGVAAHGHTAQAATVIDIAIGGRSVCPGGAHAVGIVSKAPSAGVIVLGHTG